jgi:hypothetical protein
MCHLISFLCTFTANKNVTSAWFPLTFTAKCNKSLGRQKKDFFFHITNDCRKKYNRGQRLVFLVIQKHI